MGSRSWIVNGPTEAQSGPGPVPPNSLSYTQAPRALPLESSGGYSRAAAPVPMTVGLLRALSTRWKSALLFGLLVGAVAATVTWYVNPAKYKVQSVIRLEGAEPRIMDDRGHSGQVNASDVMVFQQDQVNMVKSFSVIKAALEKKSVRDLSLVQEHKDPVGWLQDELKVAMIERTDFMTVSMSGQKPEELHALVTAVQVAYLDQVVSGERKEKIKELGIKRSILAQSENGGIGGQDCLRELKYKYEEMAKEENSAESAENSQKLQRDRQELEAKNRELNDRKGQLRAAVLKLENLEYIVKNEKLEIEEYLIDQEVRADAKVRTQDEKCRDLAEKIEAYKSRAKNPSKKALDRLDADYKEAKEQLDKLKEKLRVEVIEKLRARARGLAHEGVGQTKQQINNLNAQIKVLEPEVGILRKSVEKIQLRSPKLDMLKARIEEKERAIKSLREQIERGEIELNDLNTSSRVKLQFAPVVPDRPDYKMQFIWVAVAGLLGLIFGVVSLSFWEYRAGKIGSTTQVATDIGLRVVGTLPPLSGRMVAGRANLKSRQDVYTQSVLIESIDGIRTMLLSDDKAGTRRILMITSANAREGKTMLASHLAGSIARTGRRTLLVDCDLRRPGIHRLFDVPNSPGMSEVLRKESDLAAAVLSTRLDNLFILPAGNCDREAIERLARQELADLLATVRTEYDFVIIDSCPVLPVPDALLVSKHVDFVLMSVRPTISHAASVVAACERLDSIGVPLVGTVVNGDPAQGRGQDYNPLTQP
jgi:capsular exopolysaccharide synthesis family protein